MALVAVGAFYVDTILTTSHYPGEDEKLRATSISRRPGGNCPNSLDVLRQLLQERPLPADPRLYLLAVLPGNPSGALSKEIQAFFETGCLDDHCIYRECCVEPASSYIIKSQATGSRTIVNYNDLPEMTFEEFRAKADLLRDDAVWYHFEGRIPDVTLECIQYLRQHCPSVNISVEVEKPGRPGLQELAGEADVVFYSKSWAQGQGYESADICLHKQADMAPKASLLFCTWGEQGAWALDKSSGLCISQPAYLAQGSKIIDTIGAGDTFIAGILLGFLRHGDDWSLSKKLGFANRLAGTKVTREGFSGLGGRMAEYL